MNLTRLMILTAAVAAATLSGCVRVRPTYLAGGQPGYIISCSTVTTAWDGCLRRAGKLCKSRGYRVAYSDEVDGKLLISCADAPPHA